MPDLAAVRQLPCLNIWILFTGLSGIIEAQLCPLMSTTSVFEIPMIPHSIGRSPISGHNKWSPQRWLGGTAQTAPI